MGKQKYETVKTSTNLFKDNFDYIEKKAHAKRWTRTQMHNHVIEFYREHEEKLNINIQKY
ncbi:hypothetical protein CN577_24780 [Bacillus toyonensis]|uniref:hypothetical protein n=1 Tax=Bacillus cereus group TaxID=86661 RepID=UPI00094402F0|nr:MULTISPECIES: hypothetical protein [Bacillus cereus group]PEP03815.1 hypothetical protein CN577_24780 [Bacillus toyonensis]